MPTNQPPPFRHNKTIRVQAEGEAEISQLIRRMKAGAFRVDGSVVVQLGELVCPVGWVESAGLHKVKQVEAFHRKPDGGYWQDVRLETEWDLSGPGNLPQPIMAAIARLNVRFYRSDGQEAAIAYWFDAAYHHTILEWVVNTGKLMICPVKPTIAEIQELTSSHHLILELDRTGELKEFLATVQPAAKR